MADLVMPRLSDSMEEGTIIKWLKSVGDELAVGDELVEIETDKANMVYEADTAGTLSEILAQEGDTLAIGEPIARVGDAAASEDGGAGAGADSESGIQKDSPEKATGTASDPAPAPASQGSEETPGSDREADDEEGGSGEVATTEDETPEPEPRESVPQPEPAPAASNGASSPSPSSEGTRVKASPLAKRIASEHGVELSSLEGSGPGGRIVKADVEAAAQVDVAETRAPAEVEAPAPAAAQAPEPTRAPAAADVETAKGSTEIVELSKLQQTVARRMSESKATAPHFYLQAEIDMTQAVAARESFKETTPEGERVPTYNDMVVKACAIALREFPRANGSYRDGHIELYSRVNVGVAVAAQDALVVPTVFDADHKGLRQISAETRELAAKVRDGQITPPELSGGTFTVSNLGMFGVSSFHAVVNSPQAAILAVGELAPKPVAVDGEVVVRDRMGVALSCDHRILYGADGAQFLARVRALLEEPMGLAL
jgi:pyruvate dehydrogenase E2 component (dihydrolipoamide acetyltransferase)